MTTNKVYSELPRLIAHRGASAYAPENTAAAFSLAAAKGARWLELDITISADGVAVVHHDADLQRCSNGTGLVIQHSLAELQQLDIGRWFSAEFAGERFVTLTELIVLANRLALGLNIEIKPTLGREVETVAAIVKALAQVPAEQPLLFSSFNPYALAAAKLQLADYPRALCTEAIPADWRTRLSELDCCGLHFQREFFDAMQVMALRNAGIGCAVFTVNNATEAQRLFDGGVHAVFSDFPDLLAGQA